MAITMFLSIYTLTLFLDSLPMAGAFKGAPRRAATAFPASVAGGLGVHGLGLRGLGFRVYGLGLLGTSAQVCTSIRRPYYLRTSSRHTTSINEV